MISQYLNQTVTLKTKTSVNIYNEATYTSTSIKVRFEYKRRMIRSSTGEQVVSMASCYSETQMRPDDIITYDGVDWVILAVADQRDLFGNISHYEAVM